MIKFRQVLLLISTVVFAGLSFLPEVRLPDPIPTRPTWSAPVPQHPLASLVSMGDSLAWGKDGSVSASYRKELSRLMTEAGQPHQWHVAALPGSTCAHWAVRINEVITQYKPKIIFLNCGTNDNPESRTSYDYWNILLAAQTRGVIVVASVIGPPDMSSETNSVRPYILDWMKGTRDEIKTTLVSFPDVIVVNLGDVPAHPEWLQADGIHLTERAEKAHAQLNYKAVRTVMGWKDITLMCGLSGSWPDEPRRVPWSDYIPCQNY